MASPIIDLDRPHSPSLDYTEIAASETLSFTNEIETPPSLPYSVDLPSQSEPKILTGRRLLKRITRLANTMIKTIAATQSHPKKLKTAQHILSFAKQGLAATKIMKTVFTVSHENQDINWKVKAYNWANMMQSLIVGTITLAPLVNAKFTGGKEIVSVCRLIHSGAKLANYSKPPGIISLDVQEKKNIYLLKTCKTIISMIGELFIFIGLIFGTAFLSKPVLLTLGLAAVVLGVAKSFYKQTRTPVDEFPVFP